MSAISFQFKQFTVHHDKCAMKVGTDGVLLGAWASTLNISRALDIGTGTGLIALMLAQRCAAVIDAVEIDEHACEQARENIARSPWADRIHLHACYIQQFADNKTGGYDLIVANPPYFRNALLSPEKSRSMARHDRNLSFEELLHAASGLLKAHGRFAVVIPAAEKEHFTGLAWPEGLYPSRFLLVRPAPGKPFTRCLAEFSPDRNTACTVSELGIKNQSGYSTDYISLTKEFYLKM